MAFLIKHLASLFVSLLLLTPTTAQYNTNISLGRALRATKDDSSYWVSPNRDFAFGFQEVQDDGFLLAIWFNMVPARTIVWSANRNALVRSGSTAQVTESGWLVLNDQSGNQIWNASVATGVSYAAMLNTGNFVLATQDDVYLWQSFDDPTDTILPTQTLNQGGTLIARYTETNYSHGRFKFILQLDGNLVMYTTDYPFTNNKIAYWSTQTSIGSGYQVIFNQSGYIFLVSKNGSILNYVASKPESTDSVYQRAVLDYDGVFRLYVHPKAGSAWTTSLSIPSDICESIKGTALATGSGACGFNSYCSFNGTAASCLCPPSYEFLDPKDERLGCKPSFIPQTCANTLQDKSDLFELVPLPNTNWPFSDYAVFESQTEDWCRRACLDDCYCSATMYSDVGSCWMKKMPLSFGIIDSRVGGKTLIKVRKDNHKNK